MWTLPEGEVYQALGWLAWRLRHALRARSESAALCQTLEVLADSLLKSGPEDAPRVDPGLEPALPSGGLLPSLARRCGLSSDDTLLITTAVAPSFSATFTHAFGAVYGSTAVVRPTADLLGSTLELDPLARGRLYACLRVDGRLERLGLIHLDWSDDAAYPVNLQPLTVPERVRWWLLEGTDTPPAALRRALRAILPGARIDDRALPDDVRATVPTLVSHLRAALEQRRSPPLVIAEGPQGAGQREVAEVIAGELGLSVLELDLNPLLADEPRRFASMLKREAHFQQAVLFLRVQFDEVKRRQIERMLSLLDDDLGDLGLPIVLSGASISRGVLAELRRVALRIELKLPGREVQRRTLEGFLNAEGVKLPSSVLEDLLDRYNLDLETAREAVRLAGQLAMSARPAPAGLEPHELPAAVDLLLSRHLSRLSQRLSKHFDWGDLVLPTDLTARLKLLRHMIEFRQQVFEGWGLGRKVTSGRGIKCLFAGASGTGKTMAAEVIAGDLKLPLHRVDLSAMVSKWVGETEKQLDQLFSEAQVSQAILLFDEADALFGSRGEVEGGNDRYANLEVSYLLQRFEAYDGVVILTTNFPSVIDKAFARRLHFVCEFPEPDEDARRTLWKKMLLPSLPLEPDIDVEHLAARFELSGANIKNVVMGAAFLAAAEGRLGMSQIARALSWELLKLGRGVSRSEFGAYYRYLDE